MKWTDRQRSLLHRKSIHISHDCWLYEEPEGLSIYGPGVRIGTLKINTILAYVRRWEKARAMRGKGKP